jgi:shikimate kinase
MHTESVDLHYYDYGPTVALKKPVALIGFVSSTTESVGQILAMRSGLPLVEVDRWVEHSAGSSLQALYAEGRQSRLRQLEARMVKKALAEHPPGIISLGEGAMLNPYSRKALLEKSHLIHLRYSWSGLLAAYAQDAFDPAQAHSDLMFQAYDPGDLQILLRDRERDYELADHCIEMDQKGTIQGASEALSWIKKAASL